MSAAACRVYTICTDNPFASPTDGVAGEIWAKGLRSPFRPSFDRVNGDFYIAHFRQGAREGVNFKPASSADGANDGSRASEGSFETPGLEGHPNHPGANL